MWPCSRAQHALVFLQCSSCFEYPQCAWAAAHRVRLKGAAMSRQRFCPLFTPRSYNLAWFAMCLYSPDSRNHHSFCLYPLKSSDEMMKRLKVMALTHSRFLACLKIVNQRDLTCSTQDASNGSPCFYLLIYFPERWTVWKVYTALIKPPSITNAWQRARLLFILIRGCCDAEWQQNTPNNFLCESPGKWSNECGCCPHRFKVNPSFWCA